MFLVDKAHHLGHWNLKLEKRTLKSPKCETTTIMLIWKTTISRSMFVLSAIVLHVHVHDCAWLLRCCWPFFCSLSPLELVSLLCDQRSVRKPAVAATPTTPTATTTPTTTTHTQCQRPTVAFISNRTQWLCLAHASGLETASLQAFWFLTQTASSRIWATTPHKLCNLSTKIQRA